MSDHLTVFTDFPSPLFFPSQPLNPKCKTHLCCITTVVNVSTLEKTLSYSLWLHNKSRSKRIDTEMLLVLILSHQKGCQWVYRPYLLGGPKVHWKSSQCDFLSTQFSTQIAFNILKPKPVSQSPIDQRRTSTWLKENFYMNEGHRRGFCKAVLQGANSPCAKYLALQVLLIVKGDSHHPWSEPPAQENINSVIHTSVIHSHVFCLTFCISFVS